MLSPFSQLSFLTRFDYDSHLAKASVCAFRVLWHGHGPTVKSSQDQRRAFCRILTGIFHGWPVRAGDASRAVLE